MPEKLVLQDGSEREVPTKDELEALNKQAQDAKVLADAKTSWEKEKLELEQAAHPDWRAMREAAKKKDELIEQLKQQGKTVNSEGKIVDLANPPTAEEITKQTKAAAVEVAVETTVSQSLARYDQETQKVVRHYLGKLTQGEAVTPANIFGFLDSALKAAGVSAQPQPSRAGYTGGSDFQGQSVNQAEEAKGITHLKQMGYQFQSKRYQGK